MNIISISMNYKDFSLYSFIINDISSMFKHNASIRLHGLFVQNQCFFMLDFMYSILNTKHCKYFWNDHWFIQYTVLVTSGYPLIVLLTLAVQHLHFVYFTRIWLVKIWFLSYQQLFTTQRLIIRWHLLTT